MTIEEKQKYIAEYIINGDSWDIFYELVHSLDDTNTEFYFNQILEESE